MSVPRSLRRARVMRAVMGWLAVMAVVAVMLVPSSLARASGGAGLRVAG